MRVGVRDPSPDTAQVKEHEDGEAQAEGEDPDRGNRLEGSEL